MPSDPPGSIWSRPEPGARGATHSREAIAAAAIALADAEGFKAVSMRRVAAELGAGTMTLYHYVKNKDELIELISDEIMGELLIPDHEMPGNWRDGMAELARRSHAVFRNHPWTVDVPPGTEGGPNGLKHFEQSLAAASQTGLDRAGVTDVIFMVDDYAFGSILRINMSGDAFDEAEGSEEFLKAQLARLPELDREEYPNIHAFYGGDDAEQLIREMIALATDKTRFERGLQILLDGIERRIETGW